VKGLLKRLPPFAPDYSGVNAVFHELGGLVIINGADGCIGNVNGYDEPRFFYNNPMIVSSGLREINAIVGDEETLMEKIKDLGIEGGIPFVVLLGTPTSAVIASDHKGVGTLLKKELSVPVIPINTTGIDSYEVGVEKALLALCKTFVGPVTTYKGGVNIIGCTPLDYWNQEQIAQIKEALISEGLKINGCWTMDGSLDSIRQTLAADVNLVVSISGIKAAQYLEQEYGMPYIVGVPVGVEGTKKLVIDLEWASHNKKSPEKELALRELDSGQVDALVIGDQVWANSFRAYLRASNMENNVRVVSFFKMEVDRMEEGDQKMNSEEDFVRYVRTVKPKKIIGDPLYKRITTSLNKVEYMGVPHLAVSSRLYWNHELVYVGKNIEVRKEE
jgi:nitrogenase molybdenum-iron protein alpha/beta subunit